ncbi:hypothetical protein [Corynebacterium sp. A21]|uniref:hypothetical protein n=1 Tax=Corynebacterium sp. A21 TaxID=3457318 RepID=UPI003FD0AFBC
MSSNMDFYSLDDTLAGRLAQAGILGIGLALPDYVPSRAGRFLINTLLGVGGVGLIAYLNSVDEDPGNDPAVLIDRMRQEIGDLGQKVGPDSDTSAGDLGSPLRTWLIIGATIFTALALSRLESGGRKWLANMLFKRGIKRPHTVIGGVAAVLTYAGSEVLNRQQHNDKAAQL